MGDTVRSFLENRLDVAVRAYLDDPSLAVIDFAQPAGEPALCEPGSVAWRVFKNPVSLFIGGVAAVFLELAEPRVRTGVWERSGFRRDPVARLKRTGLAAMATVYAARSTSQAVIDRVNSLHARIDGIDASGARWSAADPVLLNWVQATASYGFVEAYSHYVSRLTGAQKDQFYQECVTGARLYGAVDAPCSVAQLERQFAEMRPFLQPSTIIHDFREIMCRAPALPWPARLLQGSLVRAAVDLVPEEIRTQIDLGPEFGLRPGEGGVLSRLGAMSDRIALRSGPPAQACMRMGLAPDLLYRSNADMLD